MEAAPSTLPKKPCAKIGCHARTTGRFCDEHGSSRYAKQASARERGYSGRWDRAAASFRQRFPLCGMRPNGQLPVMSECHDKGRYTLATCVDHVVPHRGDERLFWDEAGNWASLCDACHKRKTNAGL